MHDSLTNEATTYYEFIVTAFLAYIQGIYFYLILLLCVLSGESYITVPWNINSVLFKMDNVPVALIAMVLLTVTGHFLPQISSALQMKL